MDDLGASGVSGRLGTDLTARPVVLYPYRRVTPGGCSRDFEEIFGLARGTLPTQGAERVSGFAARSHETGRSPRGNLLAGEITPARKSVRLSGLTAWDRQAGKPDLREFPSCRSNNRPRGTSRGGERDV